MTVTRLLTIGLIFILHLARASAQEPQLDGDAELARLRDPDMDVRIRALRELSTSLDPRLPEALLPLLTDEGNSTRRLAARGIGSRWWQIPQDRRPDYVAALLRNEKSEREDERNMVARALGLLRRDYVGPMFGRSANGRWVIYERRGHPCLIDTANGTEELLGWGEDELGGLISGAIGNSTLEDAVKWHPHRDIVGIDIYLGRKETAIWIWEHSQGLQRIGRNEVEGLLGITAGNIHGASGFYMDLAGWKGVEENELHLQVDYVIQTSEDDFTDWKAIVAWKAKARTLRLVSKAQVE